MAKKKGSASKEEAIPVLTQDNIFVFQCNRPVTDGEFELIKKRLESQQAEGIKIILVPFTVSLKEES